MNDKNFAFSAMLLSVAVFAILGFMAYYPILRYYEWDSKLWVGSYHFLSRFEGLQKPLISRGLLLMCIMGSVMIYNPRKREGKSFLTGGIYFGLGVLLLFLTGYVIPSEPRLLWTSLMLYSFGFVFAVSGAVHLFQVMDYGNEADDDPFNDNNETFKQTEKRIDTPYSVNIPYEYHHKG